MSSASHHRITSLSITSGIFFRDLRFSFHDRLNFIIGGRGTGKSGVLYAIRHALGAPIPDDYASDFADYIEGTVGAGTVAVGACTQHGASYTSSRRASEAPVVKDERGNVVSVSLAGELFGVEAYAQNEIEGIGKDAAAQLALIDRFAGPEVRRIDEAVEATERRLAENAARRRRLEEEIAEGAAKEEELPSVEEALKGVDLGGASSEGAAARHVRERAHDAKVQRGRERAAMAALAGELESVRVGLDAFARDALQKLSRAVEGDFERGPHAEIFKRTHAAMQRIGGTIEGSAGRLRTELAGAERTAAEEGRALTAAHAKEDEAYQALVVRDDADRARAGESERLHKRFAELSAVAKRLGDRRREEGAAREESAALLAERARLLGEKTALRQRVCDAWNAALDGQVRAKITPQGDSEPWEALLADVLHGSKIRAEIVATIARRIRPLDLVSMVENGETGPLVAIDASVKDREARARKILDHLQGSGRLHEIAMARLDDAPLIELRVKSRWLPSNKLSPGQRCSCILLVLLLQEGPPLLVDQAEDNLDSPFICDVLVDRMTKAKAVRQLIVTTHNPNPPALAAADRIHVLDVDDEGCGVLVGAGSFEEVKEHVEMLDGGRDAFRRRAERYGLLKGKAGAPEAAP